MANLGQSTYVGTVVHISCDGKWNCCQREQAQSKANALNKACPLKIRPKLTKATKRVKKRAQARAARQMDAKKPKDRAKCAASDCLAKQIEGPPAKTREALGLQMDHEVDTKWGGDSDPGDLKALDAKVNNFFGRTAKVTGGTDMGHGTQVTAFALVCDPPCNPPHNAPATQRFDGGTCAPYPTSPPNELSPRPK